MGFSCIGGELERPSDKFIEEGREGISIVE